MAEQDRIYFAQRAAEEQEELRAWSSGTEVDREIAETLDSEEMIDHG